MHQLSENMLRVTYSFWFMEYVYIIGPRFHFRFNAYIILQDTDIRFPD